ncbi:hypothetical protein OIU77_010911 [Salix suchowensis]|uniref:CRIB domain-containing protein n=1 Tax=Salix suchowensis TaxID=1278906 RepID=A0ABQ9AB51_9ROSI|nr:hypothetical protein OIU77_010911 [Salix suchowensis]
MKPEKIGGLIYKRGKGMRDHMERFVVLPFSAACASHSSIDVATAGKKPKPESKSHAPTSILSSPSLRNPGGGEESSCREKMKNNTFGFVLALPKPNITCSIQKLIRGIKSLSQIFVYKEEDEEREMEIGYPTDVKHLAHIGLDGTTMTNPIKGWESLKSPEIISFPSFSLRQFELAMAAQAHGPLAELDHSKLV